MGENDAETGAVCGDAARMHAATARLAKRCARLDASGSWQGAGLRSCAHWLTINIGVDLWTASELLRVGHALQELPGLAAAFVDGRLSFDKMRALTRVATTEDEQTWLGVGLHGSGAQVARICRAVRRAMAADDPRRAHDHLVQRGVRVWWRDDGMLEVFALLPPEDGALLMSALDAAAGRRLRGPLAPASVDASRADLDPAPAKLPVLRADALVEMCHAYVSGSEGSGGNPTAQVVVHVDAGVLHEDTADGRAHIEDGPALSACAVRWLACDADVVTVTETAGAPLDVGRWKRLVSARQRIALRCRDQGCRYPGCPVPARHTEGHHIRHWADGGPTVMANLISLCRFHHRRLHEGAFRIDGVAQNVRFLASDGTELRIRALPTVDEREMEACGRAGVSPAALDGGERCHMEHAVAVLSATPSGARSP